MAISKGIKFSYGDGATVADSTTWTQVAQMLDFEPNEVARNSVENTFIDTPDAYQEFEPGLIDAGEVACVFKWDKDDAGQTALAGHLDIPGNKPYQIEYPGGELVSFMGHITTWGKPSTKGETIQRRVGIKISGKPEIGAAS